MADDDGMSTGEEPQRDGRPHRGGLLNVGVLCDRHVRRDA